MRKEWDTIEVLKHARHDWLNKIQLIKGNLSLNKVERVQEIINEIIHDSRQESILTNLNLPKFASALLTCNWEQHSFQLEFEVEPNQKPHGHDDERLTDWIYKLFDVLDESLEKFQENHLSVTIEMEEKGTRFYFDFSGVISDRSLLLRFLEQPVGGGGQVKVTGVTEEELSFELFTIPIERV